MGLLCRVGWMGGFRGRSGLAQCAQHSNSEIEVASPPIRVDFLRRFPSVCPARSGWSSERSGSSQRIPLRRALRLDVRRRQFRGARATTPSHPRCKNQVIAARLTRASVSPVSSVVSARPFWYSLRTLVRARPYLESKEPHVEASLLHLSQSEMPKDRQVFMKGKGRAAKTRQEGQGSESAFPDANSAVCRFPPKCISSMGEAPRAGFEPARGNPAVFETAALPD